MSNIKLVSLDKYQYDIQQSHVANIAGDIMTVFQPLTEQEYKTILEDKKATVLGNIEVTTAHIISTGKPFDFDRHDGDPEITINRLIAEKISYTIPSGYNFSDRTFTAYKVSSGYCMRWAEVTKYEFYKYCVSLIGNPEFMIVAKVSKDRYYNSAYYLNRK